MSLTRQRVLGLCRTSTRTSNTARQTRLASSDSHSQYEDANVYPSESFNTPFWRNTIVLSLLGIGIYNLLPYVDKDGTYITRYIQHYATPSNVWAGINRKHLELSAEAAHGQLITSSAMRPRVLRMRYPASLDYGSPHRIAVGCDTDVSTVVVKKDDTWTV